jgi:hypothetical protein
MKRLRMYCGMYYTTRKTARLSDISMYVYAMAHHTLLPSPTSTPKTYQCPPRVLERTYRLCATKLWPCRSRVVIDWRCNGSRPVLRDSSACRVTCDSFIIIMPNVFMTGLNKCEKQRAGETWEARGLVPAEASAISRGAHCATAWARIWTRTFAEFYLIDLAQHDPLPPPSRLQNLPRCIYKPLHKFEAA